MPDLTRAYGAAKQLAERLSLSGAVKHGGSWIAPWEPHCLKPVTVECKTPDRAKSLTGTPLRPYSSVMMVPCRKCELCLQMWQMGWRERILRESALTEYSYFVTLTFSPAHLAGVIGEALASDPDDGRSAIERVAYGHVQAYFKRLRKGRKKAKTVAVAYGSQGRTQPKFNAVRFRYFACAEYGEAKGRLHFHAVLHSNQWVPPEIFTREWRSRADAQLVRSGEGIATYVSKYLTKEHSLGRAHASTRYGLSGGADPEAPVFSGLGRKTGSRGARNPSPG